MAFPSAPQDTLLHVLLPVHMEFVNRVVEAYPKTSSGVLGSIRGAKYHSSVHQLEMVLLQKYAHFAVQTQRLFPSLPLLTTRFRRNFGLISSSIGTSVQEASLQDYSSAILVCPGGDVAQELDLSKISTSRLWAAETVRMEGHMLGEKEAEGELMNTLYDHCAVVWIRGELAQYLDLDILRGWELYSSALSVIDDLSGADEDRDPQMVPFGSLGDKVV
ncbi:hypothetical protein VNI00_010565 [Paramarasmius palmivorus]|uniref:Uncharacterized protein n=1 Tax=Paramarasmius palmivorus TaxID=297713 RepID=A0AAW0CKK8_9AGAR